MKLADLQRKYSWGLIPQWELAKLSTEKIGNPPTNGDIPKRRRGRPPKKREGIDGDGSGTSDAGAAADTDRFAGRNAFAGRHYGSDQRSQ
jgi:hypothetical protein